MYARTQRSPINICSDIIIVTHMGILYKGEGELEIGVNRWLRSQVHAPVKSRCCMLFHEVLTSGNESPWLCTLSTKLLVPCFESSFFLFSLIHWFIMPLNTYQSHVLLNIYWICSYFFFHEISLSWFLPFSSSFLLVSVKSMRARLMVSLVLSVDSEALTLWVLCGF